ncbi:sialidase family protein [Neptunitalea lumnitzerae]|uniref:Sialidase domain-containing protein n=1 Tax=Neptunitalea lumnitzerae TaxID=2965509 RepID=A0ABQ5MJL5_9FLAO|nr:sialidase family protein [Neptunitalea sp. Y10]GLB49607.1 hypothetical protein Y10_19750 [Neptunitalea sp. Y10]
MNIKHINYKQYIGCLQLIIVLCIFGCTPEVTLESKTWREGIVTDEFVFEEAPYPSCHAATITEATNGTMVAAWFGGTKERNPDVTIWVSTRDKEKWSTPEQVADGVINDTLRYPTWNPVLFQIPDGDLMLFYKVGPKPSEWWGMLTRSSDNGKTWSKPEKLPEHYIGPVKNKPELLENGTLLCPTSTEGNGWHVRMEYTKDFGKTWKMTDTLSRNTEIIDAIQPSILKHGDGKLQIICRSRSRALATAWSTDNGITWTPLTLMNLPNNNSGTDAVTMDNGKHVLIYNHVLPPDGKIKGPRTPLNISVSDNGIDWEAALILEDSDISQYSYPSIFQSSDGMLHAIYTWRRERIKYVKIDPSKLVSFPITDGKWPGKKVNITAVGEELTNNNGENEK